jgi:catechol 2,3-dioxygenase-like lactoylglutathione lyase family enzyme
MINVPAMTVNLEIRSLQHIGIPVRDIDASIAFYEGLGFRDVMPSTFELHGETGRVSMMQFKDIIIELYQLPEPERTEALHRKDGHVDHFAFDVPDVEQAYRTLKEAGYRIIEAAPVFLPKFWTKGCKYFNIWGPDGERIEFNQIL